jgi:hypothetical protein
MYQFYHNKTNTATRLIKKTVTRSISSAQDFAFTAKSVRTRRFSREKICPSPQATWKN